MEKQAENFKGGLGWLFHPPYGGKRQKIDNPILYALVFLNQLNNLNPSSDSGLPASSINSINLINSVNFFFPNQLNKLN
jgi:hypothetical protein